MPYRDQWSELLPSEVVVQLITKFEQDIQPNRLAVAQFNFRPMYTLTGHLVEVSLDLEATLYPVTPTEYAKVVQRGLPLGGT